MSFLNFVQDMQKIQEESVDVENKEGDESLEGTDTTSSEVVSEMAVATGAGIQLKRFDTKSDDSPYKNYSMSGLHNVYVDGEHAGVVSKNKGNPHSYKSSGNHYRLHPNVKGYFQSGSWKPLTDEQLEQHNNGTRDFQVSDHTGTLSAWTPDYTKADTDFEHHDAHTKQFADQQSAVDHLAKAHRAVKEFGGDKQARYDEAEQVKDQYLNAKAANNRTGDTSMHLQRALWAVKKDLPEDHDLHAHIQAAMEHPKLVSNHDEQNKLSERFRTLTHDLPERSWTNTSPDIHAHLRDINTPWKV